MRCVKWENTLIYLNMIHDCRYDLGIFEFRVQRETNSRWMQRKIIRSQNCTNYRKLSKQGDHLLDLRDDYI